MSAELEHSLRNSQREIILKFLLVLFLSWPINAVFADTFADNFNTQSYANQDGSHNWSADWVETNDFGGVSGGDINITGGRLHLQDDDNSISREVDLSGYFSATLSFDYEESDLDNAAEYVDLEIRTGGGGWVFLQRFAGPSNNSGSVNIDISSYLASDTEIRFVTSGGMENGDDFYVDNLVIDAISASVVATYLDLFSSVSYSNQDGSLNWAADWDETGDNDNPASGDIDITGGELHLDDNDNSISRRVDLSAALSATLSFDYREVSLGNAAEYIDLEIRTGGGSWVFLQRFRGPSNDSGSVNIDISGYLAADTEIRFITSSNMEDDDDFYVDNFAVDALFGDPVPVGYWHLEEGSWNGTVDQVQDVSGNDLHGTTQARSGTHPSTDILDPAIAYPDGTCGYGVFDGANRGFVQINDPGSDSLLDFETALTVTAWIHPRSLPGSDLMTIISKDTNFEFHVTPAGQINWWWNNGADALTTSGTPLTSTETDGSGNPVWHHIAITYSSGSQKIYIDGVERASGTATGNLFLNDLPFFIGTDWSFDSRTFDGFIDEVIVYSQALSQAQVQSVMTTTHPCTNATVDHYRISFDGGTTVNDTTAVTCEAVSVTIVAHGAGHLEPVTPGVGTTINLSTSTGNGFWSSPTSGSVVDNGNGDAIYTFAGNDAVTLQFNHTVPALTPNPVNIQINSATSDPQEDVGEDPSVQFYEAGFRFVDAADNPIITNQVAAQSSGSFYLQAIRTDNQTGQCVGVFNDGATVDIELAAECNDPLTCAGEQLNFTNDGSATLLSTNDDNGAGATPSYTTVNNVLFITDSKAEFTLNYPDVGALSLHARYELLNDDGSASGEFMLGSSNGFIVTPADFVITGVNAGAVINPGTTSAGTGFVASGDPFRVVVESRNAAGNLTPNFGNEINSEGIQLSIFNLVFPTGGNVGTLGNAGAFTPTTTAGEFENNSVTWNDVGTFTAFAQVADGDYLGAGNILGSTSGNIGRFYPAYFDLVSSAVSDSCTVGNYSYLSDPSISVSYQLAARDVSGNTVANYDNTDLTYPTTALTVHGEDNNDGVDLGFRTNVATTTWNDGVINVLDNGASINRALDGSFNVVPDGPLNNTVLGVSASDIDGANISGLDMKPDDSNDCVADGDCSAKLLAGILNVRFGQLRVDDVHGPESAPIPMRWQMEYWNGSQFVLNTDDQCTQLPLTDVTFVGATTAVDAANDNITVDIGGVTSVFNFSDPVGSADCLSTTDIGFCSGRAGVAYGAPGSIITYPIDIDLNSFPYLQGDWNQDGSYDDVGHPRVNVRFQHYRGHDRIIYWRERLQ